MIINHDDLACLCTRDRTETGIEVFASIVIYNDNGTLSITVRMHGWYPNLLMRLTITRPTVIAFLPPHTHPILKSSEDRAATTRHFERK
jgi:hypothetical protein